MDEDDAPKPAGPSGLYDPRFEHDACGVSFVVDIKGRASRRIVDQAIGALCNLDHRGATGAEANTGDGAGILMQVPDRFLRDVVDFALPPAGRTPSGWPSCPPTRWHGRRPWPPSRSSWPRRACDVLGWRDVPVDRTSSVSRPATSCPSSGSCSSPTPRGPRASRSTGAVYSLRKRIEHEVDDEASVAGGPSVYFPSLSAARSSTRACSPRRSSGRSSPTWSTSGSSRPWPWCTPASRPTRSRRGRSPTRTATSPTTARSTRSRATATGCGPARRCSAPTLIPGDLGRAFPICTPGRVRLGQLRRGARAAPPRRSHRCPTRC